MNLQKNLLAKLRKADNDFNLINDNDIIVVGVSGGKDSILLCYLLNIYQKFSVKKFKFYPVMLDLGFDPHPDLPLLKKWFEENNMPLLIQNEKQVYEILKKHKSKDDHLPCSICSRMKKAAINKAAHDLNANKVSFAHHADDAIETLFMNMTYGGRINTFEAVMHLERAKTTFIRPLIYFREEEVIQAVKNFNLPVLKSHCPNDKHTSREDFKQLLNNFYTNFPESKQNFLNMLTDYKGFKLLFNNKGISNSKNIFVQECINFKDVADLYKLKVESNLSKLLSYKAKDNSIASSFYKIYLKEKLVGFINLHFTNKENNKILNFKAVEVINIKNRDSIKREALDLIIKDYQSKFNPIAKIKVPKKKSSS